MLSYPSLPFTQVPRALISCPGLPRALAHTCFVGSLRLLGGSTSGQVVVKIFRLGIRPNGVHVKVLPLPGCVTLDNVLHLSEPNSSSIPCR